MLIGDLENRHEYNNTQLIDDDEEEESTRYTQIFV